MRADRLLSILLIISSKGVVTGKELAEHFNVSIRTIYRDIDEICLAGVPITAAGGAGGGFSIMEGYSLDNLYLNKGELQTLMAMIDSLKAVFGRNQQFNDIVAKFQSTYKKEQGKHSKLYINISHFSMEDELKEYLYLLDKAIEESRLLLIQYVNRNMELSERIVEPIRIEYSYGQWYVTGYCRDREDFRRFKLVRIKKLSLGEPFSKRSISEEELRDIFLKGYEKNSIKVKLKFSNRIGDQLTEYFNKQSIMETEDGAFMVEADFPYEEGLVKFILGFGNDCEVIDPQYLRKDIETYVKNLLQKYNG